MKAELKRLHSPDVDDLTSFVPDDPDNFSLFLQAMVGPAEDDSEESFDFVLCTPAWLREKVASRGPQLGLHHLVVVQYDHNAIRAFIERFCGECSGTTWRDVAVKVGQLGRWEFEDYQGE